VACEIVVEPAPSLLHGVGIPVGRQFLAELSPDLGAEISQGPGRSGYILGGNRLAQGRKEAERAAESSEVERLPRGHGGSLGASGESERKAGLSPGFPPRATAQN